jgi:hypothetical protein
MARTALRTRRGSAGRRSVHRSHRRLPPHGPCRALRRWLGADLSADRSGLQPSLWIGLRGVDQRLAVILGPEPRRSPNYWHGPAIAPDAPFDLTLLIHTGMGSGGILCRTGDEKPWSSLAAASPWGAERLVWPERWSVGHASRGPGDQPFRGSALTASVAVQRLAKPKASKIRSCRSFHAWKRRRR